MDSGQASLTINEPKRLNDATEQDWNEASSAAYGNAVIEHLEENGIPDTQSLVALHEVLSAEAQQIMWQKNHDYSTGSGGTPFDNFMGSLTYNVPPIVGVLLRIQDKCKRIETFARKGELKVDNEGLRDACRDILNYIVIIYGMALNDKQNL